ATRAPGPIAAPALSITCPSTVTCPARINARARSRDGASPRSISTTSSRAFPAPTRSRFLPLCPSSTFVSLSGLLLPCHDPVRDRTKVPVGQLRRGEGLMRSRQAFGGQRTRAIEAEQRRIRRLVARGVFACRLAERRGIALHVQDIVDDLESETDVARILVERRHEPIVGARQDSYDSR